jgi:hypothetical protein
MEKTKNNVYVTSVRASGVKHLDFSNFSEHSVEKIKLPIKKVAGSLQLC